MFKVGNENFCPEGKVLRAFKEKIQTTFIKAEPRASSSAGSLNGRCPVGRGSNNRPMVMMVSLAMKEGHLRGSGRRNQKIFAVMLNLG